MRDSNQHSSRGCALAVLALLTSLCVGQSKHEPGEVLVGLKHQNTISLKAAIHDLAIYEGIDRSGMFIVRPNSLTAENILRTRPEVRFVLPLSARFANPRSYRSVDLHAQYIDDADALKDPGDQKRDAGDFYEALRYYLRRRVAVGTDIVDAQAQHAAQVHVASMPKGHLGLPFPVPGERAPAVVSGSWDYLGPRNLQIPYQIYYGTPPLSGRISCIAYDPTDANVIYAGSGGGGLWKTIDGGSTWSCISDSSPWIYPAVDSIAVDPANHKTLYVGTGDFDGFFAGYNQGIMKSTDGGMTWSNLATNVPGIYDLSVSHIVIDPANDQIVTCTTGRGSFGGPNSGLGNIYRSTNGGASWTAATSTAANYCCVDISQPGAGGVRTYWACGSTQDLEPVLLQSINQGATWTPVSLPDSNQEDAWCLACSKVNASTVYLVATGSNLVYKTTDNGLTWGNISAGLPGPTPLESNWSQATYDYFIGTMKAPQATAGEVVFCGLITVAFSLDGGETWDDYGQTYQTSAIMHNDQHQFAISATDGSQVLVGNDGGLFRLRFVWNGSVPSVTLQPLNAQLGITQFYFIAPHPTDTTRILGGAQDNAGPSALGDLGNWQNLGGGDGGYCGWDIPEGLLFMAADMGTVYTYDLTGNNVNQISPGFGSGVGFEAPTVLSPNGAILYLGTDSVLRANMSSPSPSFAGGGTVLATDSNDYVNVIAPAPGDNERVYAATVEGLFWLSTNAGASFTQVSNAGLPQAVCSALDASPVNENDVLAGFQNTGTPHLYHTTNMDTSSPVWRNVSGTGATGLPDAPLNAIVRDPYSPATTWYVGTDVGVFMTQNSGATWSSVNFNLPPVQIFDLKFGAGYLYAGTFGRGIWRVALPVPLSSIALAVNTITAGTPVSARLALAGVPYANGDIATVSASNGAASAPPAVSFAQGTQTASFVVNTSAVSAATSVTITASAGGVSKSAVLTVEPGDPVSSISLSSTYTLGGNSVNCTVALAKSFGSTVNVQVTSNSQDAAPPGTVSFATGTTSRTFAISTKAVSAAVAATLTATAGGVSKSATLTVNPLDHISAIAMRTPSAVAGNQDLCTVALEQAAPLGGITVTFKTSNPYVAPAPPTTGIAYHSKSVQVPIVPYSVQSSTVVMISATAEGVTKTATLTVLPAGLRLTVPTPVYGGMSATGSIQLAAKASSPTTVTLTASSSIAGVPNSVVVPDGSTTSDFAIATKGVDSNDVVQISAKALGTTQTSLLTLYPAIVSSFTLNPSSVVAGHSSDGVFRLMGLAGPSSAIVTISTGSSAAVSVQSSVRVPAGAGTASFPISTNSSASSTSVTITVTLHGRSISQILSIQP